MPSAGILFPATPAAAAFQMAVKSSLKIERINALAELERVEWTVEPVGDYEVKCKCPVHEDKSPSVSLNVKKNVWICQAAHCKAKGDIVSLLAHISKVERRTVLADLSTRYDLSITKSIKAEAVEGWHEKIWKSGPLLQALRDRGVSDAMGRKARLGVNENRITIPVYDMNRRVINVRKYLPGAPGPEKMRNTRGYTGLALFQVEQTKYQSIWICGGEMKALVAAELLNQHGIGCVSVTAGEGAWSPEFTKLFKDKIVYLCFDVDKGGRVAARKVAPYLTYEAQSVSILHLPLDRDKYPKGDLNDYIASEGATDAELLELMTTQCERFVLDVQVAEDDGAATHTSLSNSISSQYMGRRISCEANVVAMDTTPYIVPKELGISCSKDQEGCPFCPVKPIEPDEAIGKVTLTVKGTSAGILDMIDTPKKMQREAIREALMIPPCKVASFTVRKHWNVYALRLTPQLQIEGDNADHVVQSAFVSGPSVELNTPYHFSGRVYPHPKTQQAVLLFDKVETATDTLSSYEPTEETLKKLKVFQPSEWTEEALSTKIDEVYDDIEANVTRIFRRRDLHLCIDVTYHSVLFFNFDEQLQKGWINTLITGDSSQGKSETSMRLMDHYKLGARHECKNATSAGLLGGLQQLGSRWFVSWGIIPMHDKRLVVLEEIKGTPIEVLAKLTDMRSSGIAELSKIEKRKAHARTRLVMISNPRRDKEIASYNFGVEAIKELIGSPEDVRRFDLAVIVSSSQIEPSEINRLSKSRPKVAHRYTTSLCHQRVLWAWTRTPDKIEFDDDAAALCLVVAIELCSEFTEAIPLVDRGTMRFKLARIACALAAMSFSTDDLETIRVRKCHVDYAKSFILRNYNDTVFGYADFSKARSFAHHVKDPKIIRLQILHTKYPRDLVEHILHTEELTLSDVCDWCELDRADAQRLISFLVRKHAIYRHERSHYTKTSEFIVLLKEMLAKGIKQEESLTVEEF